MNVQDPLHRSLRCLNKFHSDYRHRRWMAEILARFDSAIVHFLQSYACPSRALNRRWQATRQRFSAALQGLRLPCRIRLS